MRAHAGPAVIALLVLSTPAAGSQRPAPEATRQRPLEGISCNRNELTSYNGVVIGYRREFGRTTLRIRTDWDTTEQVVVQHAGTDDPSPLYRVNGKPFTPADWAAIEVSKGVVRPETRAAAWVCADGKVLIDWGVPRE